MTFNKAIWIIACVLLGVGITAYTGNPTALFITPAVGLFLLLVVDWAGL